MNKSWLDRNRQVVFVALLVTAIGGAGLFYFRQPAAEPVEIHTPEPSATIPPPVIATPTPAPVRVYVTGAVTNPDVYFLPQGCIIKDAILAAGGVTAEADLERINQALELRDQQQIHVPRRNEENPPPPVQGGVNDEAAEDIPEGSKGEGGNRININTASLEELDSLPGIGPAIGQRIIDYRNNVGGFKSVEEITQVSGIGEATLAKIRDQIVVE